MNGAVAVPAWDGSEWPIASCPHVAQAGSMTGRTIIYSNSLLSAAVLLAASPALAGMEYTTPDLGGVLNPAGI